MNQPLMPKATAVWLIDNTALTFEQIADFCNLHILEVKGIADGDVDHGIRGADPIAAGQLTRLEIEDCQKDKNARLKAIQKRDDLPEVARRIGKKYTPLSKRQDRPDSIFWLVRNHPELLDSQIGKLVGTTKSTIQSIRDRTHWNSANLNPVDPVSVGLCTQIDLDNAVQKAFKRIGNIPIEFQELTKGDLALVQNLKQQYFTQFKDVSNTFTRRLSEKVYQNTLVGNSFTELERELRQTINGIYASSDDAEANRLVDFVNKNKYVKSKQSQVDKAIQTLQTKFARDRSGENMKRFAGQILNDSLRDFDATLNFNKANDAGLTFVKYYGDVIPTTREICRNLINGVIKSKRQGGLFTIEEVKRLWTTRSWSGKKSGNPLVVRGGYNCRHQWSYVNPDWYNKKGELII